VAEERLDFNQLQFPEESAEPQRLDYNDMTFGEKAVNDVSVIGQALESGARGFLDNMMNLPNAIGDVAGNALAYRTAGVKTLAGMATPESMKPRFNMATGEPYGGFGTHLEQARNTFPMSTLIGGMNVPTTMDLQALAQTAPQAAYQYRTPGEYDNEGFFPQQFEERELTDLGERFSQYRDEILEGYIQRREAQPVGAASGDILGDVATLVTGRAPLVSAARTRRLSRPPAEPVKIEPGMRRFLKRRADDISNWARTSGVRLTESGIEGAILAALQDEDPASGAAFGVGAQMVGNATDTVWRHFPGKTPSMKLAYGAICTTALIQVLKSLTPGGRDRILESEESAFNKMAYIVAAGALSQAAGFGRPSRTLQDDLGAVVDS
jgi:hypothetical protein